MSDKSLFSSLVHSLEHAKDTVLELDDVRDIPFGMVITDSLDDVSERYDEMEKLSQKMKFEYLKVFLYDLQGTLRGELEKLTESMDDEDDDKEPTEEEIKEREHTILRVLQTHSSRIKELKQENTKILLSDSVKNLLFRIRSLRQISSKEEELSKEDAFALTDYFIEEIIENKNSLNSILTDLVDQEKPSFIYCKPPLLGKRDEEMRDNIIGSLEKTILRRKPNGSWLFLQGDTPYENVKSIASVILAGQDETAMLRNAQAIYSLIPNLNKVSITYLTIVDNKNLQMASLASDQSDLNELKAKLSSKITDQVNRLRIGGKTPDSKVIFGEPEDVLQPALKEIETDLMIIAPKPTGDTSYDEEVSDDCKLALRIGVSAFITY